MYYVARMPNGNALVSTQPIPDRDYVEVESLPDGEGRLCMSESGKLFRVQPSEPTPSLDQRVTALEDAITTGLSLYEGDLGDE